MVIPLKKSQGDIEVAAKSLAMAIASPAYPDVKFGVKLVAGNIGREKNVFTFPHFCAFLLPRFLRELDA